MFCHLKRLDQSRGSENIWRIYIETNKDQYGSFFFLIWFVGEASCIYKKVKVFTYLVQILVFAEHLFYFHLICGEKNEAF